MALWPKGERAYIRCGWGFFRDFVFERATENLPCVIDAEEKGDVFVILDRSGTRARVDKRAVQVI